MSSLFTSGLTLPADIAMLSEVGGAPRQPPYANELSSMMPPELPGLPSNLIPLLESYGKMGAMNTQQRYANDFYTAMQRLQGGR